MRPLGVMLLVILSIAAVAQTPAGQVSGGYQYLQTVPTSQSLHGFDFQLQENINPWAGGVANVAVVFPHNQQLLFAVFGPQFTYRAAAVQPFIRPLLGVLGTFADGNKHAYFAAGGGGGVDIRLKGRLYMRTKVDILRSTEVTWLLPSVGLMYQWGGPTR